MSTPQLNLVSAHSRYSAEEWQTRVDLAAAYRLVALFHWDDLVFTHISARVPGSEDQFLINPYGMMFDEITASSLVKVDQAGNKLEGLIRNWSSLPGTRALMWVKTRSSQWKSATKR